MWRVAWLLWWISIAWLLWRIAGLLWRIAGLLWRIARLLRRVSLWRSLLVNNWRTLDHRRFCWWRSCLGGDCRRCESFSRILFELTVGFLLRKTGSFSF
jgi:hypothetical protein